MEPMASASRTCRPSPACVEITFGRGDVNLGAIAAGSIVWKTDDPAIRRRLEITYSRDVGVRRELIALTVEISAARHIMLRASDAAGRQSVAAAAEPLQQALKHPLTVDFLREQLNRLPHTPFELGSVALVGLDGPADTLPVLAPRSLLNDLRRRVVGALMVERSACSRHTVTAPGALAALRTEARSSSVPAPSEQPSLHVLVRREEQLSPVLERFASGGGLLPATVYIELDDWSACGRAVSAARSAGIPVVIATPRILMSGETAYFDRLLGLAPDAVLVRNLGSLSLLHSRAPHLQLIGDYSLNVANELAADLLLRSGLTRITPGLDLNLGQWLALRSAAPLVPFEAVIHAHVPMFHMAHCVAAAALTDSDDCMHCNRPCRRHEIRLRDRLDVDHPVFTDAARRTTVFNGNVQSAADLWGDLDRIGVRHVRIELLDESPPQAAALLDAYADLLTGRAPSPEVLKRVKDTCRARVVRGTWEWV